MAAASSSSVCAIVVAASKYLALLTARSFAAGRYSWYLTPTASVRYRSPRYGSGQLSTVSSSGPLSAAGFPAALLHMGATHQRGINTYWLCLLL